MPSSILIALTASSATALNLPGVGEVALKLPRAASVLNQQNLTHTLSIARGRQARRSTSLDEDPHLARRSAPALPSTKDLKIAAIDFVSEARQNPLSALPAVGAAGAAGLVLFAAASTLTAPPVAEGGVYKVQKPASRSKLNFWI